MRRKARRVEGTKKTRAEVYDLPRTPLYVGSSILEVCIFMAMYVLFWRGSITVTLVLIRKVINANPLIRSRYIRSLKTRGVYLSISTPYPESKRK